MTTAEAFDSEIKKKIPITQKMGMKFIEFNPQTVKISVELAPNINHVQSAFGGSIYSAAATACYGLFRAMAEIHGFNENFLVIQDATIEYKKPVKKDFVVIARKQSHLDINSFLETVKKSNKGRLPLEADVLVDDQKCAVFRAHYVLKLPVNTSSLKK